MPLLIAALVSLAGADNLLANGGFEEMSGERPARWDVFVAPYPAYAEDASPSAARASREAAEGEYAVMLENPQAYPSEPYNNWSQNVIGAYGGKTLTLSGRIRTEEAEGGAGIWLQCWRKNPLRVVGIANSATGYPLYGTTDWTSVEVEIEVPEGADLLTVRCVLKGAGKAWFDEVRLTETEVEEDDDAAAEEDEADAALMASESEPTPTAPSVAPDIEAELSRLREANMMLAEALEAVRDDNRMLLQDLLGLRETMRQLQEALSSSDAASGLLPPLVPRDFEEPATP